MDTMYKLNNDSDWKPKLNDKGQIVGIDDKLKACKTINKDCFGHASSTIRVEERRIEHGRHIEMTKKDFDSTGYEQRIRLYNTDPKLYRTFSNGSGTSQVRLMKMHLQFTLVQIIGMQSMKNLEQVNMQSMVTVEKVIGFMLIMMESHKHQKVGKIIHCMKL